MKNTSKILITALLTSFLTACGGGGGGGSDISGAADVRIDARPRTIDAGDRILVSLNVRNIHPNGIALKVKFPLELSYVQSSAVLDAEEDEISIVPDVSVSTDKESYLVFYLQDSDFGDNEEGTLTFELQGKDAIADAEIETDPDVDDPLIDNSIEFSVDTPLFSAEDSIFVTITG